MTLMRVMTRRAAKMPGRLMKVEDMLTAKARRWAGACSATRVLEPMVSAPAEKPWIMRQSVRRTGAQTPACS